MSARLSEVTDALSEHGHLLSLPTVEIDGNGHLTLTLVVIPTQPNESLAVLSLYDELRHVADLAQMRALCSRFDIEPDKLEKLISEGKRGTL